MFLVAYFDESKRQEGDEPIAIAGFLFKRAAYERFQRQWRRTVLRYEDWRFSHFHMTDLCSGHQEYEGLSIAARVEILDRAVDAIAQHSYAAIAVYFQQAEFERVAPPEWPQVFGSIYSAACHMCIQATGHWLSQWQCPMRVVYVFEQGHDFQGEANDLMISLSKREEARKRFHYRNHLFGDKKTECGLQAADLFAWAVTKSSIRPGQAPPAFRPFLPSVIRLARSASTERQAVYPLTGKKLLTFMQDQMDGIRTPERAIPVKFGPRKRTLK